MTKRQLWVQKYNREYHKKNRAKVYKARRTPVQRFSRARLKATSRGLAFEITKEQFFELIKQPCTYCGTLQTDVMGISLDRINNDMGYNIQNVLPCCGSCNRIRGDNLTVAEMRIAMTAVLDYRIGALLCQR